MITADQIVRYDASENRLVATIRILLVALALVGSGSFAGCADSMDESGGNGEAQQADTEKLDDKNADFAAGGKADALTTEELRERILHIANTYSFEKLDAFLHAYAARGIVDRRERHGSYESLRDLDKAYYVGRHAFGQLLKEARSLPDGVLEDGNAGDEIRVDRTGSNPTVVLEGPLAQKLQQMFDRVYRGGTRNTAIDCRGTGNDASCDLPVARVDANPDNENLAVRFRGAPNRNLETTKYVYYATRQLGSYVRGRNARVHGRFQCRPHNSFTCEITNKKGGTDTREVVLQGDSSVLPELGDSRIWEGWLIVDGNPVSTGHFRAEDDETSYAFRVDAETAKKAAKFVLTIEPSDEPEGTPSSQKYLAGPIQGDTATISTTNGPTLSGADLSGASGVFFLAAPSGRNVAATDYRNGIWFIDNSGGTKSAGLDLPELGEGWTYEGWVVKPGTGPVSTGRFDDPAQRDSDAGGPFAGPAGTPPLPGQDFVARDGRRDLTDGYKTVISVEPQPDDSPKPFAVKPLASPISDDGKGTLQNLSLNEAGLPEATVTIR